MKLRPLNPPRQQHINQSLREPTALTSHSAPSVRAQHLSTGSDADYLGPRSWDSRASLPPNALYSHRSGSHLGRPGAPVVGMKKLYRQHAASPPASAVALATRRRGGLRRRHLLFDSTTSRPRELVLNLDRPAAQHLDHNHHIMRRRHRVWHRPDLRHRVEPDRDSFCLDRLPIPQSPHFSHDIDTQCE